MEREQRLADIAECDDVLINLPTLTVFFKIMKFLKMTIKILFKKIMINIKWNNFKINIF